MIICHRNIVRHLLQNENDIVRFLIQKRKLDFSLKKRFSLWKTEKMVYLLQGAYGNVFFSEYVSFWHTWKFSSKKLDVL